MTLDISTIGSIIIYSYFFVGSGTSMSGLEIQLTAIAILTFGLSFMLGRQLKIRGIV